MKGIRFAEELLDYAALQTDLPLVLGSSKGFPFYIIYSPTFSSIQRASTLDGAADYRTGISIQFYKTGIEVGITSIFSRTLLQNFIKNNAQESLNKLVKKTYSMTEENVSVCWASKSLLKQTQGVKNIIKTSDPFIFYYSFENDPISNFNKELSEHKITENWISDIGCFPPPSGMGKMQGGRGSHFSIVGYFMPSEKEKIKSFVKFLIPYFASFLPREIIKGRNANLRRALIAHYKKIDEKHECAHIDCRKNKNLIAAHIKPHAKGGSDTSSNGLWLCSSHHLAQENKPSSWHKTYIKKRFLKHTVIK
jgi:hypothetical protein